MLVTVSAGAAGVRGDGLEAILLSRAAPAGAAPTGAVPVAIEEGEAAVASFVRAVRALPRNPVGAPAWRFDVVRGHALADSFLLSEREVELLGVPVKPLLQRAQATPSSYLYRAALSPAALSRLDGVMRDLSAAGFRAYYPAEERAYWSSYEVTFAIYGGQAPSADAPVARSAAPSAATSQIEARLRSLIPRPLDAREEDMFQRMSTQLQRDYQEISTDPAIRSLQVDYARQRWLNAADRRNLLITARYFVRTPAELQAIERHCARVGGPKGRSIQPESISLQLLASDADAARVRARLAEIVPELRDLHPGR